MGAGTLLVEMTDMHPITANHAPAAPVEWGRALVEHAVWIRSVILARTGERQAVDEVFQQVSLAAVEQDAAGFDPSRVAAWLYRVAVIRSIRHRRERVRDRQKVERAAASAALSDTEEGDPFHWLLQQERRQIVRDALMQLKGKEVEILMLKYQQRWSYRRIAETLGISEKAVDGRVARARERLRNILARYFEEPGES